MKEIKLGEIFCGPGGISLGAEIASLELAEHLKTEIKHAWAVDYHQSTVDTFIENISGATKESVLCADVRNLDFKQLKKISDIDGLAYGFPCNDFSLVGEKKGLNGEFGPLYKYGVEVLNLFNPKFFIAENVGGLRGSHSGDALRQIIQDLSLSGNGYTVTPHLYKFEEYGVPQCRHRIILVGIREDLNVKFRPPAPTNLNSFKSCMDALNIPEIPADAYNNELTLQHPRVVARLKHIKPGENAWTANLPDDLKLNVKGAKLSQIYKRLDPNKPAYTITGSGGGGTHVYHWSEPRSLTNRERARLQTFPDKYRFCGGKEDVRRQIGMAVPPYGAKVLFEAILKTLESEEYKSVDANLSKYQY
ncbi:MAG: DNA (cytosine-5-)-methyltransferase [Methylophilaceae bacterium]|nr:DNA (cytosine-5-)-methyltransferase [Methylophilaceae bacterium]